MAAVLFSAICEDYVSQLAIPPRSGFTLIEVMVVILVLATLVAPNVCRHVGSARDATTRSRRLNATRAASLRCANGIAGATIIVRPTFPSTSWQPSELYGR